MTEPISLLSARVEIWRTKRQDALTTMMCEVDYLHDHSRKRIQDIAQCFLPAEAETAIDEAVKRMTRSYNEATDVLMTLLEQFAETRPPCA